MGERIARTLGAIFVGAIVWTIAKALTDNRLGAIPTMIILSPFIYWAYRAWNPAPAFSTSDADRVLEQRLEAVADNQKLPLETRETAKRHLEELRQKLSSDGSGIISGGNTTTTIRDDKEAPPQPTFAPHFFLIMLVGAAASTVMGSVFGRPLPQPAVLLIATGLGTGIFCAAFGLVVYYVTLKGKVGRHPIGAGWGAAVFVMLFVLLDHLNP